MALEVLALGGGVLTHMAEAATNMPPVANIAAKATVASSPFLMSYLPRLVSRDCSLVFMIPILNRRFYLLGESINRRRLLHKLGRIRRLGAGSLRSASRRATWALGRALPLSARQRLVAFVGRQKLPTPLQFEFAMGMLTDLRRRDPVALHRFLWANHLAYAASYEVPHLFGAGKINPTRHVLFDSMAAHLRSRGVDPGTDSRSVLEIGCSQGYLLRHLETTLFRSARILHGLDLDAHAIKTGSHHLDSLGSCVRLFTGGHGGGGEYHRQRGLRRRPVLRRSDVREREHR